MYNFDSKIGADSAIDLRSIQDVDGNIAHVLGNSTRGDGGHGDFYYDGASTASDDGVNTLRPNIISAPDPGRWIRYRSAEKRTATFSGTTNGSGEYTVSYSTSFPTVPNVQPTFITTDPRHSVMVTASSTTGFTVKVVLRNDVLGLLPTYTNVASVAIQVLVVGR